MINTIPLVYSVVKGKEYDKYNSFIIFCSKEQGIW